ncbi:protein ANKUB1-like [Lampris incognitus]|uniref:protein ANKUB1-like n=1 Tax=Lampris incognitus TaxID=2546036 RepID=UPI0024B57B6C|nr:protein ANKUB1-like [Lampris incognitus]
MVKDERFQLRVALYIAAFQGHLDLADWLLERDVYAGDPVGIHPYRQWCHQTAHPDVAKCPVQVAAERGQLLIPKLFIANDSSTLDCRDPVVRDPLKVAIRHRHGECVRYLATKLCSVVSLPFIFLSMPTFPRIKYWVSLGRNRVPSGHRRGSRTRLKARVGNAVLVDGITQPKMPSKPRKWSNRDSRVFRTKALQHLPSLCNSPQALHLPSNWATQQVSLPPVRLGSAETGNSKGIWRKRLEFDTPALWHAIKFNHSSQWRSLIPLPPITRDANERLPLVDISPNSSHILTPAVGSFSHRCGCTPRENAVYCLAVASTFTEKSWTQQLSIDALWSGRLSRTGPDTTDPEADRTTGPCDRHYPS